MRGLWPMCIVMSDEESENASERRCCRRQMYDVLPLRQYLSRTGDYAVREQCGGAGNDRKISTIRSVCCRQRYLFAIAIRAWSNESGSLAKEDGSDTETGWVAQNYRQRLENYRRGTGRRNENECR